MKFGIEKTYELKPSMTTRFDERGTDGDDLRV